MNNSHSESCSTSLEWNSLNKMALTAHHTPASEPNHKAVPTVSSNIILMGVRLQPVPSRYTRARYLPILRMYLTYILVLHRYYRNGMFAITNYNKIFARKPFQLRFYELNQKSDDGIKEKLFKYRYLLTDCQFSQIN